MTKNLLIISLIVILFIFLIIFYILKKGRMSVKYALVWFFAFGLLFLFVIIPGFLSSLSRFLGFQIGSNFIFAFLIGILILVCLSLTVIVSGQKDKIRLLIQEVSIIKSELRNKELQNEKSKDK